jgi:hypothetical protein
MSNSSGCRRSCPGETSQPLIVETRARRYRPIALALSSAEAAAPFLARRARRRKTFGPTHETQIFSREARRAKPTLDSRKVRPEIWPAPPRCGCRRPRQDIAVGFPLGAKLRKACESVRLPHVPLRGENHPGSGAKVGTRKEPRSRSPDEMARFPMAARPSRHLRLFR